MRKSFYGLSLLSLLACESRKQNAVSTERPSSADSLTAVQPIVLPSNFAVADTATPFKTLGAKVDSLDGAPMVVLGAQIYRILLSAKPDTTKPRLQSPPQAEASADSAEANQLLYQKQLGVGYDVLYTVQLVNRKGNTVFRTDLHKADFAGAMGAEHVVESVAHTPSFLGYLPKFGALAFSVDFYPDESDAGGGALLLLDAKTGKKRYGGLHYWAFGGAGADALTPDGRTLVFGSQILHADGRQVSLDKKDAEVAGTLLLNSDRALVVYEEAYDPVRKEHVPIKGPNAHLIDLNGKRLSSFRFSGTQGVMGYAINYQYLRQTQSYYLFDYTDNTLRVIPQKQPLDHRLVALQTLPKFEAPQQPREVRFSFNPESSNRFTLYVDTVSGALRYQLLK